MIELLIGMGGMIAAVILAYFSGRSSGKIEQQAETQQEVIDNVAKAKKAADDVAAMPADDRRERLRQYTKK